MDRSRTSFARERPPRARTWYIGASHIWTLCPPRRGGNTTSHFITFRKKKVTTQPRDPNFYKESGCVDRFTEATGPRRQAAGAREHSPTKLWVTVV